jgi:hypothetical protein
MTEAPVMNAADLDTSYTALCHTMTRLGEPQAPLFLARFALLAMSRLADPALVQAMITDAEAGLDLQPTLQPEVKP